MLLLWFSFLNGIAPVILIFNPIVLFVNANNVVLDLLSKH